MDGITNLLSKLSLEDIEKLKILMSLSAEAETKEVITLRLFTKEYKTLIQNNRSVSYYRSVTVALNYLESYFKPQRVISGITLKDVESFLVYLKQKVVKGYVVYFRNLKAAFNKAKDWGYVKENYFTKIKLPKRQRVQPAFIDSRQLEEICKQLAVDNKQEEKDSRKFAVGNRTKENDVVRDVAVIGFYTGMRLNEIVSLKWKNVDLNNKIITVGDEEFTTKGREQRFIPICDEAMEVLFRREKAVVSSQNKSPNVLVHHLCVDGNSNYVFCKSKGVKFTGDYFSKRFKSACLKAGIDKSIHFHSLRHSFASNLVQKGVSLYKIKELLGHSSISTTEIYSHLNLDSLRDAIKTLDDSPEHLAMISTTGNREFISSERNSLSHLRIFSLKG